MKWCPKCKVEIRGNSLYCPLCQGRVVGEGENPAFPIIPTVYEKYRLFFQLLILSGMGISVAAVAVNLILPWTGKWSLLVLFGIGCLWLSVGLAARNLSRVTHLLMTQSLLGSLLVILWDVATGWRGWSLDYAVPLLLMVSMLTMQILIKVKGIPAEDYLVCTSFHAFVGLVPLIFYLTGILGQTIPSILLMALSLFLLSGQLIFKWQEMKEEYHKRFRL